MYAYLEQSPFMGTAKRSHDPRSPEAVGRRLLVWRAGLNRTQAHMTARLEGTPGGQTWHNYEKGQIPSREFVYKIAQAFGLHILWILEGNENYLTREQEDILRRGEARLEAGWKRPNRSKSAN